MKKLYISALFFAGVVSAYAQAQVEEEVLDVDLVTWYHKDFTQTNTYGVNTQNAYKYLEAKGLRAKPVVVGVLDSGVEVDHPGLKSNMWVNPKEIAGNGKDDDGNGYVDDIHGWNFIGGKEKDVDVDNMEVTRVVKKYQEVFEGSDSVKNKDNQLKFPEEFQMYMKSKEIFSRKSLEAQQGYQTYSKIQSLIPTMVSLLGDKTLIPEVISSIKPETQDQAIALSVLTNLLQDPSMRGSSAKKLEQELSEQMKGAIEYYGPQATKQYNLDYDPRAEIVGDNYDDYNERIYGNNNYEGPDAQHGTHVAGIIAAVPTSANPQYGVAYKTAKIMSVRTVPNGDERDKDVANAIRYAVDNGARILNMSFGKPVSPGKEVVWDAMRYAQSKGVLLIKAAGNENEDIAQNVYYPTNFTNATDPAPFIDNMLVVGASTNSNEFLRADFSNFNGKMVDVFAPGDKIYSTVPDAKYEYLQGTSMAAPVVAGAAAVLWAYMPNLSATQIIESLIATSNKSTVNAMLPVNENNRFDLISKAGGVIDLGKAAQYAYENFHKASLHKSGLKKTGGATRSTTAKKHPSTK